jgi:drug/metabolite transporter (DMT)-like permease
MRTIKSILILSLVSFLIFGFILFDEMPKDWFKAGSKPNSYKVGIDTTVFKNE